MPQLMRLAVLDTGEPAVRVLLAAAGLNRHRGLPPVTTIALHPEPHGPWYTRDADERVPLPPEVYRDPRPDGAGARERGRRLIPERVVDLLLRHEVDALWPGRAAVPDLLELTTSCEEAGIGVVGPRAATLRLITDRAALRSVAADAQVPVLPHAPRPVAGLDEVGAAAGRLGYPVVLRDPRYGRGGGEHRVASPADLPGALRSVAEARHGSRRAVFVERDPGPGRRLEVEVIADGSGTVWALDVRDASVLRHGHRVLVESGCPGLPPGTRRRITEAAVRITTAVGYRNAGAVRFLLTPDGAFHLVGIDPRVQADHALTEQVCGIDVLALRLAVAAGTLLKGPVPEPEGHAVECYLFARDPARGFADAPGPVVSLTLPGGAGVRVDATAHPGDPPRPDGSPLLATLTAWGRDRGEALARLRDAVEGTGVVVDGGATDRHFLLAVLDRPELAAGAVDDHWLDQLLADGSL